MQSLLHAKEREQNIKNAFAVKNKFNFTHIAIIDDVYTTGFTVHEFAKTLKKAGISKIDVWCLARGALIKLIYLHNLHTFRYNKA